MTPADKSRQQVPRRLAWSLAFGAILAFTGCQPSPALRVSMDTVPADTPPDLVELIERLRAASPIARGQALIDLRDYRGDTHAAMPFVIELLTDNATAELHTYQQGGAIPDGWGSLRKDRHGRMYRMERTTVAAQARHTLQSRASAAARPLVRALENKDPRVAEAVAYLLTSQPGLRSLEPAPLIPKWEEGCAIVHRVLQQDNPVAWIGAASVARYLRAPEHVDLLIARAADKRNSLARRECILALGAHAVDPATSSIVSNSTLPLAVVNRKVFVAILHAVDDPDPEVKEAVAVCLAGVSEPEAARVLGSLAVSPKLSPPAQQPDIDRHEDVRDAAFRSLHAYLHRLPSNPAERALHPFTVALRDTCPVVQLLPHLRNRQNQERNARLIALVGTERDVPALINALTTQPNDAGIIGEALRQITGEKFRTPAEWLRWHGERAAGDAAAGDEHQRHDR